MGFSWRWFRGGLRMSLGFGEVGMAICPSWMENRLEGLFSCRLFKSNTLTMAPCKRFSERYLRAIGWVSWRNVSYLHAIWGELSLVAWSYGLWCWARSSLTANAVPFLGPGLTDHRSTLRCESEIPTDILTHQKGDNLADIRSLDDSKFSQKVPNPPGPLFIPFYDDKHSWISSTESLGLTPPLRCYLAF